jgi:hypothetical protein
LIRRELPAGAPILQHNGAAATPRALRPPALAGASILFSLGSWPTAPPSRTSSLPRLSSRGPEASKVPAGSTTVRPPPPGGGACAGGAPCGGNRWRRGRRSLRGLEGVVGEKKEMWVNQLPTDGSLEPEVEQSFFFGSAQFCFSIFGYWVVGSTQQNLHR